MPPLISGRFDLCPDNVFRTIWLLQGYNDVISGQGQVDKRNVLIALHQEPYHDMLIGESFNSSTTVCKYRSAQLSCIRAVTRSMALGERESFCLCRSLNENILVTFNNGIASSLRKYSSSNGRTPRHETERE